MSGALLAASGQTAAATSKVPPYRQLVRLFSYDHGRDLQVRVLEDELESGVRIRRISFVAERLRLDGTLLVPEAAGRHPGVLFAPEGVDYRDTSSRKAWRWHAAVLSCC